MVGCRVPGNQSPRALAAGCCSARGATNLRLFLARLAWLRLAWRVACGRPLPQPPEHDAPALTLSR